LNEPRSAGILPAPQPVPGPNGCRGRAMRMLNPPCRCRCWPRRWQRHSISGGRGGVIAPFDANGPRPPSNETGAVVAGCHGELVGAPSARTRGGTLRRADRWATGSRRRRHRANIGVVLGAIRRHPTLRSAPVAVAGLLGRAQAGAPIPARTRPGIPRPGLLGCLLQGMPSGPAVNYCRSEPLEGPRRGLRGDTSCCSNGDGAKAAEPPPPCPDPPCLACII